MKKSKTGSGVILGVIGIYLMIPLLFTFISVSYTHLTLPTN